MIPVIIAIVVGFILTGNTPTTLGQEIGNALSSALGQVALMILMASGLGMMLKETGISPVLCREIISILQVKTTNSAIIATFLCEYVISFCLGSFGSAAAIVAPILMPLWAAMNVAPVTATVAIILSGSAALFISPFYSGVIMAMKITGLSYMEYLIFAGFPCMAVLVVSGYFVVKVIQKCALKSGAERYEMTEAELSESTEVTAQEKKKLFIFFPIFIIALLYAIVTGQGMAYILFVLPFLSITAAIISRMKANEAVDCFCRGCSKFMSIFLITILYQIIINITTAAGGFDALFHLINGFVGDEFSQSSVMIVATLVGVFGINGGTSVQMQIIHELFLPMVQSTGLSMKCWAIVLLSGSYLTTIIYPQVSVIAPMGMCNTKDFKNTMLGMWLSSAIVLLLCILYALIVPGLVG